MAERPVELPASVENLIKQICMEQNQQPLDRSPRQQLAMIGEQKALELLTKISKTKIQRSFDGYIVYLITNPSSNYVSPHKPSPPPSSLSQSSISPSRSQLPSHPPLHCVLTALGELEFRKSFLLMSYAGGANIENFVDAEYVERLKDLPMRAFENEIWEAVGKGRVHPKDRQLVECSSLNQELQDMEARLRREQKKSPEEANQVIQMQAWQEEVERARQGQREAENKLSSLEAELQKLRVEMSAMKRDAEHYSRQEHTELEKRYRELTDLLYYKQTQLETMVSEKAATEFQLEKEIKRLKEAQAETERSRVSRRASSTWEDESEIKALEPLPLHHRHLAGASIQLQKAIKLLDSGAVRATRFLWRYPTARVFLFFYLVFVHLFLMYLLHRLQVQADSMADREVAASMGLSNQSLP